jgi:hypothetical protein
MSTRQLPDLAPSGSAASEQLHALVVARAELDDRLDALDDRQRQASEDVARLSEELSELERAAAVGEQVTPAHRTKAENALMQARLLHGQPWAERREGIRAAARDADRDLNQFVAEHLGDLVDELHETADAAAQAVDRACHTLVSAYAERQAVEARVSALTAMVRNPRPGDVARTRAEAVVREANRLLEEGGEQSPRLVVDPRAPRHGETIAEAEQQPAA